MKFCRTSDRNLPSAFKQITYWRELIPVGPSNDHEHHFHIDFKTPSRVGIIAQPQNLTSRQTAVADVSLEQLAKDISSELQVNKGLISMLISLPVDYYESQASMLVADAASATAFTSIAPRNIGVCFGVNANLSGLQNSFSRFDPSLDATRYLAQVEKLSISERADISVALESGPRHGAVHPEQNPDGSTRYEYAPNAGFVGDERIVYRVSIDGTVVRVVYLLKVSRTAVDNISHALLCRKTGVVWKISQAPQNFLSDGRQPIGADIEAWTRSAAWSQVVAHPPGVILKVGDIFGAAVGETAAKLSPVRSIH